MGIAALGGNGRSGRPGRNSHAAVRVHMDVIRDVLNERRPRDGCSTSVRCARVQRTGTVSPYSDHRCREVHPMLPIPADIFTEPADVSPDGVAHLGPLRRLAGVWQADKGVDINPKAQGPERRIFREHIRMDPSTRRPTARSSSTVCAITSTSTRPRKTSRSTTRSATGFGSPRPA